MTTTSRPRTPQVPGHVEVVCGPMFAGKSEELLRRVRRAVLAGLTVEVISHAVDDRRGRGTVSSHSGLAVPAVMASEAYEIEEHVRSVCEARGLDVVAIDEAQFFGLGLVDVVQRLAGRGIVVLVAGLDVTFESRPFEPLPSLCALAERVTRLTAVCGVCGADAAFHERVTVAPPAREASEATVSDAQSVGGRVEEARAEFVGGAESYGARCRHHLALAPWAPDSVRCR
ncbi:thymidine kinase [Sanguibacter sp. A247]|uniref:thymidine kinase n=1 Tax=unclassified Sanguibacter TaxID=2645534 RepID=UPI003FD872A8